MRSVEGVLSTSTALDIKKAPSELRRHTDWVSVVSFDRFSLSQHFGVQIDERVVGTVWEAPHLRCICLTVSLREVFERRYRFPNDAPLGDHLFRIRA